VVRKLSIDAAFDCRSSSKRARAPFNFAAPSNTCGQRSPLGSLKAETFRSPMNTGVKSRPTRGSDLSAFVVVFATLAALFAAWVGWRISVPLEINVNEPWNALHAGDALAPDRLYLGAESAKDPL
jgi:hypothetical protein